MSYDPKKMLMLVNHPLIQHKLSVMRDVSTPTAKFRQLFKAGSACLWRMRICRRPCRPKRRILQTPLEKAKMPKLEGKKLCFISILREQGMDRLDENA